MDFDVQPNVQTQTNMKHKYTQFHRVTTEWLETAVFIP